MSKPLKLPSKFNIIFIFLLISPLILLKNLSAQCFNNADCSDGNPCNGVETCQFRPEPPNICVPGTPSLIGTFCNDNDENPCTTGFCNGVGTCIAVNNNLPCNDGHLCTKNDRCNGGTCVGSPVQCSDGVSCTLDSCNDATGICEFDASKCPCQVDADCDDQNDCTDEFCNSASTCVRLNNKKPCDDGLFCNGTDTCQEGICSSHSGDPCVTQAECNQPCNETDDKCFAPKGMGCQQGQCDGQGECTTNVPPVKTPNSTQGGTLCSLQMEREKGNFSQDLAWILLGWVGILILRRRTFF